MMFPKIYAFIHIEKCGGQTLTRLLRRNFGARHADLICVDRNRSIADKNDLRKLLGVFPNCISLSGHNIRPSCDFGDMTSRMRYYTLLREPIARYVSDYKMHVRGGFQGNFAQWSKYDMQHNLLVHSFSRKGDLREAMDVFSEKVEMFDTIDNFDRFLGKLKLFTGLADFDIDYKIVNAAPTSDATAPKSSEEDNKTLFEKASVLNQLDLEFYAWAVDRLNNEQPLPSDADIGRELMDEHGIAKKFKLWQNYTARNLVYKPLMGMFPSQVDKLPKYKKPWDPDV